MISHAHGPELHRYCRSDPEWPVWHWCCIENLTKLHALVYFRQLWRIELLTELKSIKMRLGLLFPAYCHKSTPQIISIFWSWKRNSSFKKHLLSTVSCETIFRTSKTLFAQMQYCSFHHGETISNSQFANNLSSPQNIMLILWQLSAKQSTPALQCLNNDSMWLLHAPCHGLVLMNWDSPPRLLV